MAVFPTPGAVGRQKVFVVSIALENLTPPALCPVLALKPTKAQFKDWCAAQHNLTAAVSQTAQLIASMRFIISLLEKSNTVKAAPADLAALMTMLTERAETVLAHLDAVSDQA